MRGVVLLAVENPVYAKFAFNMALSIKHHSPNIPIQLIADHNALNGLMAWQEQPEFFDYITKVDESFSRAPDSEYNSKSRFTPAKAKMSIYDVAMFEENIFLDVDGVMINAIEPLFELNKNKEFSTQVIGHCKFGEDEFPNMLWSKPKEFYQHFKVDSSVDLTATNSSFIYFKKGVFAKQIFATALDQLMNNRMPRGAQHLKWGTGQPDELYLNASLALNNYDASMPGRDFAIYFSSSRIEPEKDLQSKYFAIGLYGPKGQIHSSIIDYCEMYMRKLCEPKGFHPPFKYLNLMKDKFQHKRY